MAPSAASGCPRPGCPGVADLAFNTTSLELDYKRLLWGTRLEFYANAQLQIAKINSGYANVSAPIDDRL